jgi:hypothetical protein
MANRLTATDRIYTITEDVGITGELCGGKYPEAHQVRGSCSLPNVGRNHLGGAW